MSSFGTKKPGADFAVQMTFPHIFSEEVSPGHIGYYPEAPERNAVIYPSHDLQGIYHQQKMEDAHRRVRHAVRDTAVSKERWLHSHAGYFNMPKPVLSQRRYANPSNGNTADIYNNRNVSFAVEPTVWSSYRPEGLRGGVLYTAEAQKWGRDKLKARIPQLDAITAEKEAFVQGLPVQGLVGQTEGVEGVESSKVKLEIVSTLRAILSSVEADKADSFAWSDTLKFMRLFFRWAPSATEEELEEVLEYFDYIEEALIGIQQQAQREGDEADKDWNKRIAPNVDIMLEDFQKLREYLTKMMKAESVKGHEIRYTPEGEQYVVETEGTVKQTQKTLQQRKALSANLIKSIGFTTLNKASNVEQEARIKRDVERGDVIRDQYDPPIPSDNVSQFSSAWAGAPVGRNVSHLAEQLRAHAEEQDRLYRQARFDPSVRERMGRNNGSFFGEQKELLPAKGRDYGAVRNPFRHGTGEDQAQGLEEGREEYEEIPSIAPSRSGTESEYSAPSVRGFRTPRSSRSSSSRAESAPVAEELSDAELRSRLGAPSAPAPVAKPIARQRPVVGRITPEMVRAQGRTLLPNNQAGLLALANRWREQGLGNYKPRGENTTYKSLRKKMITLYNL